MHHYLVLDRRHGSEVSPVVALWQRDVRNVCRWPVNVRVVPGPAVAEVLSPELLRGEVGQLSGPVHSAALLLRLQPLHQPHVGAED